MYGKISVIISVYNAQEFLKKCLDSVFVQNYENYEVICVNDGSTDDSYKILKEYAQQHENMRCITQENQGPGAARNVGIRHATGDYIAFLDSDDYFASGYFSAAVKKLEEDKADLVMFNPIIVDSITGKTFPYRNMLEFYQWSRLGGFPVKEVPLLLSYIGCWDKFYRKSLLDENNIVFSSPRIFEDVTYGIYSQVCANKISVHREGFYYYRKNTGKSITDKEINNKRYRMDFLKNLVEMREFLHKKGCDEKIYSGIVLYVLRDGMFHLCYTRPYSEFVKFFNDLRSVFSREEWNTAHIWGADKIDWFIDILLRGDVKACKKRIEFYLNQPLDI